MLEDHAREEFENPLPQKAIDDRTIYLSRNDFGRPKPGIGTPKITDFGLASWGHVPRPHNHAIQPEIFRAPEVILAAGWTYSVDIWNLGVMLWNLLEGRALFEALNPRDSNYTSEQHIAHISALLGPPPKQLLARGERTTRYFSSDGEFKHSGLIPRDFTLAGTLRHVKDEDKRLLLEFVKRMLQWLPEDRSTARELLSDPWLKARFPEETD
ncbi:MAG: hypothetical protein M1837_000628 [Sclerophora amabilis]|nr:MAG: hypothetical protein M1837_000628 [Sclerophora amabilis]